MQSKLPVRIKKKFERKKCCCNKFLEIMIQNPSDAYCSFCTRRGKNIVRRPRSLGNARGVNIFYRMSVKASSLEYLSNSTAQLQSTSTQTEIFTDAERKSFSDIKTILLNINDTLEAILETLQDKKEFLYNKLQDECSPCKKTKVFYSKNKGDKFNKKKTNQLVRKHSYGWPDISRLYYGQPTWLKNYMQKIAHGLAQNESNLVICPRSSSWIYTARPNSCPNINYFQPMGKIFERRKLIEMSIRPAFAAIGQGDLTAEQCKQADELEEKPDEIDQPPLQEIQ